MSIERPMFPPRADSAGERYVKTDISPKQIFQDIGRLRREAMEEIDRLLQFLDATETDADLEEDLSESGIGDQDGLDEQVPFRDWQNVGMV
jgi:hypothetical protein